MKVRYITENDQYYNSNHSIKDTDAILKNTKKYTRQITSISCKRTPEKQKKKRPAYDR